MMLSLTGCAGIGEEFSLDTHSLAVTNVQNLKINRAGDLDDKPSFNGTAQADSAVNKTNKKLQADAEKIKKTVFKSGDNGNQVIEMQKKLNKFGYNLTLDGNFGEETEYIVMDFQFRHNLEINGIVSGKTLELLNEKPNKDTMYKAKTQSVLSGNEAADAGTYESEVNSTDCPSYTNYLIMVSISKQHVYIFNGSVRNWKLINDFSCATGRAETPTIRGNFYVGDKGTQFTPGNGVYCKYYSQISGNYLFHSILYDSNGKVLDSTLGETASHGCVRLALENAKYIYDNVPIGSGIWIH